MKSKWYLGLEIQCIPVFLSIQSTVVSAKFLSHLNQSLLCGRFQQCSISKSFDHSRSSKIWLGSDLSVLLIHLCFIFVYPNNALTANSMEQHICLLYFIIIWGHLWKGQATLWFFQEFMNRAYWTGLYRFRNNLVTKKEYTLLQSQKIGLNERSGDGVTFQSR